MTKFQRAVKKELKMRYLSNGIYWPDNLLTGLALKISEYNPHNLSHKELVNRYWEKVEVVIQGERS